MPAESISVVYQPVVSFAGLTAYHETLVYTDASGNQSFASAGASTPEPGGSSACPLFPGILLLAGEFQAVGYSLPAIRLSQWSRAA